jgi:hypothetical protein
MEATVTMQQEAIPVVRSNLALKRRTLELALPQYQKRLAGLRHFAFRRSKWKIGRGCPPRSALSGKHLAGHLDDFRIEALQWGN